MIQGALPQRVAISQEVIFQDISGECVLLDMASEQYFGLDDVGTRMWHLLVQHGETETVLAQLRAYYAAAEDTLRHDLATFIQQLREEGLVKVDTSAAS